MPLPVLSFLLVVIAIPMSIVMFGTLVEQVIRRRQLEERLLRTEIFIREEDLCFARARARIADRISHGRCECVTETIVAVIGQPSPPVSERAAAIENVHVGLSLK